MPNYNLADTFKIVIDDNDNEVYSMNQSIYFTNVDKMYPGFFQYHVVGSADTWPLISYQYYNTVNLWWIICKLNDIKNPTKEEPIPGTRIKVFTTNTIQKINTQIRER
jgi:hypothetical protein